MSSDPQPATPLMHLRDLHAPGSTFNIVNGPQVYNNGPTEAKAHPLSTNSPCNNAPFKDLSHHFRGRSKELAHISASLDTNDNSTPSIVIYGPKGIGKKQLMLQFANIYQRDEQQRNSHILWISAGTQQEIAAGYDQLLCLLDPSRTISETYRLRYAQRWLDDCTENWLLLFRDVTPDIAEFLISEQLLPSKNPRGRILFTTATKHTAKRLASAAGTLIELPLLGADDAAQMLLDHLERSSDLSKAKEVIKYVSRMPIAILFVAEVTEKTSLDRVLQLLRSGRRSEVVDQQVKVPGYNLQSLSDFCNPYLDDLEKRKSAVDSFLKILAFFDPQSIPLNLIQQGSIAFFDLIFNNTSRESESSTPAPKNRLLEFLSRSNKTSSTVEVKDRSSRISDLPPELFSALSVMQTQRGLNDAVNELTSHMVVEKRDDLVVSLLDLYHIIVQDRLRKRDNKHVFFELAVNIVYSAFKAIPKPISRQNWDECETFIPHVNKLNELYAQYMGISIEGLKTLMEISTLVAGYLYTRERYDEAEKLYTLVVRKYEKHFQEKPGYMLSAMQNLADLYELRGRWHDAEALYSKMLEKMSEREVLATKHRLAAVYLRLGMCDKAEELYAVDEKMLESDSVEPETMGGLAKVYVFQRRYDEAQNIYGQILARLPKDDPRTCDVKHDIALAYMERVDFDESGNRLNNPKNVTSANRARLPHAQALLKDVLDYHTKRRGPQHPETLTVKSNLGKLYQMQNRYKDALALFQEVLEGRQKCPGQNHLAMKTKQDIAGVLSLEGHHEEAKELLVDVLKYMEDLFGPKHQETRFTQHHLGRTYRLLKEFDKAEQLLDQVVAEDMKEFGLGHPYTKRAMNQLAKVYLVQDRRTEAKELLERANSSRAS